MAYIIDSNCFIEPFKRYYGFEVCPGYWDWIDQQNNQGNLYSLDRIANELIPLGDDLSVWARNKDSTFFLPTDQVTIASYQQIVTWVNGENFSPTAKAEFMRGADPFLVAFALAHGHTVVTDETHEPTRKSKVKIPNVCIQFNVQWTGLHNFLKAQGARFNLA